MGTSLIMMGLHEDASRCYESAIKLAFACGAVASQCEVLECLIWVHSERMDFSRALECVSHLKHIHESAEEVDYEVLCQDHVSEAGMYAHLREWADAKAAYVIALDLARTKIHDGPNQQKWLLRATTELAQACVQLGELKEGLDLYAESLLVAMSMRDDEKAMKAHMYMGTVYKMRRDLEGAITHLDDAIALAVKTEDVFMEGRACLDSAAVLHLAGHYERAIQHATRALEIAETLDDDEARGECSTRLAEIFITMGEPKRAVPRLLAAIDVWRRLGDGMHMAHVQRIEDASVAYHLPAGTEPAQQTEPYCREDTERVDLIDEHSDTWALLVEAHTAIDPDEYVQPLVAAEAGRCVVLRSLISLDRASLRGPLDDGGSDPLHPGFSSNVMPSPINSEAEMVKLVKRIYPCEPGTRMHTHTPHSCTHACTHTRAPHTCTHA